MSNAITRSETAFAIGEQYGFERNKVQLIKELVAKGTSDDELALFLYTAQRTGLDPLARQIYCIMRKDRGVAKMTIQTGIDGYRLIADRTGNYAPGRAPTFEYTEDGSLYSATAYVQKYARGTWHEVAATAHWAEYASIYDGKPSNLWASKPHIMLAKCAEALALRRAFPAELSGLYTDTEMGDTAPVPHIVEQQDAPPPQQQTINQNLKRGPSPEAAAAKFWRVYEPVLGARDWSIVQALIGTEAGEPETVDGWAACFSAVGNAIDKQAVNA